MSVSRHIEIAIRILNTTPVHGPRIPHRQTHKNFDPKEGDLMGMLFRHDLKDMMLFAELGESFLMFGTQYWKGLLTDRQLMELICYRNFTRGCADEKATLMDAVWDPDEIEFHRLQAEISEMRFITGTQLQAKYGSASGIFLPEDCDVHFNALKELVFSQDNRRWWLPLALLLRAANTTPAINGIRDGKPWFKHVPSGERRWQ